MEREELLSFYGSLLDSVQKDLLYLEPWCALSCNGKAPTQVGTLLARLVEL